jgi:excisionase family DNA binding protein
MSREKSASREPMMTAGEVARQLSMSRAWVYQHANGARNPRLLSHKMGSAVRFKQSDVDDFVKRLRRDQIAWTAVH